MFQEPKLFIEKDFIYAFNINTNNGKFSNPKLKIRFETNL